MQIMPSVARQFDVPAGDIANPETNIWPVSYTHLPGLRVHVEQVWVEPCVDTRATDAD